MTFQISCPSCGSSSVRLTAQDFYTQTFRCTGCGRIWSEAQIVAEIPSPSEAAPKKK